LAQELLTIPDLKAVFIGTSSGTTAQALAEFFLKNTTKSKVEVHIIQTTSCHPIADNFTEKLDHEEKSLADAIVDHTALRKDALVPLIEKTGGNGWIATNEEIGIAQELANKYSIQVSLNSALSIVGLMQALYTGKKWNGSVACMICGD
jgi:hypothetical protein